MPVTTKSYNVRFYQGVARSTTDVPARPVSEMLRSIADLVSSGGVAPQRAVGGELYELRDLTSHNEGAVITGVLAVLRDDAPHIREASGDERPIELADGDAILEKNHFIYYRNNELLVWQVNGRGSHVSRFERYLTAVAGVTVVFDDILSMNALDQLAHGIVTRLEFRIARPRNAALLSVDEWEGGAFDMMSGADATQISVKVSTRRRSGGLSDNLKSAVHRLLNADGTRKVSIKLRGVDDPIDLIAECLKSRITVSMDGLYPDTSQMFSELEAAKGQHQDSIDAYFGRGDAVLD